MIKIKPFAVVVVGEGLVVDIVLVEDISIFSVFQTALKPWAVVEESERKSIHR